MEMTIKYSGYFNKKGEPDVCKYRLNRKWWAHIFNSYDLCGGKTHEFIRGMNRRSMQMY